MSFLFWIFAGLCVISSAYLFAREVRKNKERLNKQRREEERARLQKEELAVRNPAFEARYQQAVLERYRPSKQVPAPRHTPYQYETSSPSAEPDYVTPLVIASIFDSSSSPDPSPSSDSSSPWSDSSSDPSPSSDSSSSWSDSSSDSGSGFGGGGSSSDY